MAYRPSRNPYKVAHLIAYFSYEQVSSTADPPRDTKGVSGERCDRQWVEVFEEHLCRFPGTYRDNKHSFLQS